MSERTHTFTRSLLIACAKRELALRDAVYPKRVADGKMTQEQASHEIDAMSAILAVLENYPLQCYAEVAVRVVVQDLRNRGGIGQIIERIPADQWKRIEACMVEQVKDNVVYKTPRPAPAPAEELDFA